jgi:hypothetical protein
MPGYHGSTRTERGAKNQTASICPKSAVGTGGREGHANRAAHPEGDGPRNSLELGGLQFCGDGPEFGDPVRVRRSAMN